jgi:hypothetical protein
MTTPLKQLPNHIPKAPRPLWPWLAGLAALGGGVTAYKKWGQEAPRHHRIVQSPRKSDQTRLNNPSEDL